MGAFNQRHSKQLRRIETRRKRAVCSYWKTLTKDDPICFATGSLLGGFAEMLNIFQQLLRISLKWNPALMMLQTKNMSGTKWYKKERKSLE